MEPFFCKLSSNDSPFENRGDLCQTFQVSFSQEKSCLALTNDYGDGLLPVDGHAGKRDAWIKARAQLFGCESTSVPPVISNSYRLKILIVQPSVSFLILVFNECYWDIMV